LGYYLTHYSSIQKMPSKNIYTLFIEKGVNLTRNSISYIVPEGLFKTRSYKPCVNIINSNCNINFITYFSKMVFANAVTGNLIFLLTSKKSSSVNDIKTKEYIFDNNLKLHRLQRVDDPVIEKMSLPSFPELGEVCNTFKGMVVKNRKLFVTDTKDSKKNLFLLGKSISNWIFKKYYYANYEELTIIGGTKNKEKHDAHPRILIRRTGDSLVCALLEVPALTESTLYSCWSKDSNFETKYIFALLNSSIYKYYVRNKVVTNAQAFPQILLTDIKELPIPNIEISNQRIFLNLVDKILNAKSINIDANTFEIERQIDQLVYQLYDLTDEEIAIVEKSPN